MQDRDERYHVPYIKNIIEWNKYLKKHIRKTKDPIKTAIVAFVAATLL